MCQFPESFPSYHQAFSGLLPVHPREEYALSLRQLEGEIVPEESKHRVSAGKRCKGESRELEWQWCGRGNFPPIEMEFQFGPKTNFLVHLLERSKSQEDCRVTLKMKKKRSVKNSAVSMAEITKDLQLGVLVYR